ncbi:MAG TPA: hypothetical protein H9759_09870 [Candidatus Dietzia intestinipullorum]|nr:hypothetical protein [Candidatus Dietzia intestinipullorum]
MDSLGNFAGSAIVGAGGALTIALSTLGSTDAARFVSEQVVVPLLGSVAPDFVI